eukprot:860638-Rhodomonas_salina.1
MAQYHRSVPGSASGAVVRYSRSVLSVAPDHSSDRLGHSILGQYGSQLGAVDQYRASVPSQDRTSRR